MPDQAEEGERDDADHKATQQHGEEVSKDHAHDDDRILEGIHDHAGPYGIIIEVPMQAAAGGAGKG